MKRSKPLARLAAYLAVVTATSMLFAADSKPGKSAGRSTSRPAAKPKLPPAPPGVTIIEDVTYLSAGRSEKLDLYLPADRPRDTRSPAVVIIHGGGWSGGDKAASREFNIGTTLARVGYVCASVNYKLDGADRWPINLHDCKNAVRFLRARAGQYQIDPEKIGVIGGSAGGHLALMVAYTAGVPELEPDAPYPGVSSAISAVIDLYGITNPATRRATDKDGTPQGPPRSTCTLVKGSPQENPAAWRLVSPVAHVSSKSPPTLILHGTKDTTVDRDQSKELAERLAQAGVEHELMLIPNVGHTFDLQTWARKPLPTDLRPVVIRFLDKHVRRSPD